eukprot:4650074-Pyramimonas_sp.AAC.1
MVEEVMPFEMMVSGAPAARHVSMRASGAKNGPISRTCPLPSLSGFSSPRTPRDVTYRTNESASARRPLRHREAMMQYVARYQTETSSTETEIAGHG